ncbi:MAG: VWA domain-containing protein, partial [Blastocatellia bacterium]
MTFFHPRNGRWLWLLSLFLLQQTGSAQEPPLRIKTDLVQIDVAVKDQKGNLVRTLRREDFEILEDGKPQPITHFALGSTKQHAVYLSAESAKPKNGATTLPTAIQSGRYIVLAIDDYHLAAENLVAVKLSLTQFIERELAPDDQVALVVTSGALGLYQQFTRERAALLRAVNRLSLQNRTTAQSSGVPNITDYQAELIDQNDTSALQTALEEISLRRGRGLGSAPDRRGISNPRAPDEAVVRSKARAIVQENARYTAVTLSTLEKTIRGLRDLPGRKVMVLLSDGFFSAGVRTYTPFDFRFITDAATRAGVVIYTLDARGLVAKPTMGSAADQGVVPVTRVPQARPRMTQGEIGARQEGLFVLARDSGGIPFFNNNDLGLGLRRVLDDTEAYYVLAYEPTNATNDGRFRKIEVRIAAHPEFKVQTRAGYFAPTALAETAEAKKPDGKGAKKAPAPSIETAAMQAALSALVPLRSIPLEAATHFLYTPQTGPLALLTARFAATTIGAETQQNQPATVLDIAGVIFSESGKPVSNFSQSFALKANEKAQAGVLQYHNVSPL